MSQRELDYIPEYEKTELAREVVSFYPYQPENFVRVRFLTVRIFGTA